MRTKELEQVKLIVKLLNLSRNAKGIRLLSYGEEVLKLEKRAQ